MGVEPTTRLAKRRVAGFEGREGHRTNFASAGPQRHNITGLNSHLVEALPTHNTARCQLIAPKDVRRTASNRWSLTR